MAMRLSLAIQRGRETWAPNPAKTAYLVVWEGELRVDSLAAALAAQTRTRPPAAPFTNADTITRALAENWPQLWKRVRLIPGLAASITGQADEWLEVPKREVEQWSLFKLITVLDRKFARTDGYTTALVNRLTASGL